MGRKARLEARLEDLVRGELKEKQTHRCGNDRELYHIYGAASQNIIRISLREQGLITQHFHHLVDLRA